MVRRWPKVHHALHSRARASPMAIRANVPGEHAPSRVRGPDAGRPRHKLRTRPYTFVSPSVAFNNLVSYAGEVEGIFMS
jgi:hypothetical protein